MKIKILNKVNIPSNKIIINTKQKNNNNVRSSERVTSWIHVNFVSYKSDLRTSSPKEFDV